MKTPPVRFAALFSAALFLTGCSLLDDFRQRGNKGNLAKLNKPHVEFRGQPGWRKKTFRNEALMAQATSRNAAVEIALREQRGLLLVDGAVAMDFPVATGKSSHPTPKGSYKILEKKEHHSSNLYGRIVSESGSTVVADADTRDHGVPVGGRFIGAPMPYWMRMTTSGVGMHVGNVPGHRTASHGCIRLKREAAVQLFTILDIGSPVTVDSFAPSLGGPLGTDSVVVAEVTAKPPRPRPRAKPKVPEAPAAVQPAQVAANEAQLGSPANEVSTATTATEPAAALPEPPAGMPTLQ